MDLDFSHDEQHFRQQVCGFLDQKLPADIRRKVRHGLIVERDDYLRWQGILHVNGWGGPGWPAAFGGTGWNSVQQYIFEEECAAAGAPRTIPFGLKMVAPVLMQFGSPAQQKRHLPSILSGDTWWCQGYSEPGAGSDLAALSTRAERAGSGIDEVFVVNG